MKKVRLPDGQEIQLPSSMSDLDVQRVVKLLINKLGDLKVYEKGKEVVLINTEFPEIKIPDFPEYPKIEIPNINFPEQQDNTPLAKLIAQTITILTQKIDAQTEAITKALDMQNDVLAELVVAYREPKKITRDNMGRLEGIE